MFCLRQLSMRKENSWDVGIYTASSKEQQYLMLINPLDIFCDN